MNEEIEQRGSIIKSRKPVSNDLLIALINRGVIRQGTELLIPRPGRDLSGGDTIPFEHTVEVLEAKIDEGKGYCSVRSTEDNACFRIGSRLIYQIDGMEPSRIAYTFGLTLDGSSYSTGKKRGRKSKKRK